MPGRLIVCATPIGNLADASPRLAATLAEADVIFAEDTRRTRILLDHLGVTVPTRSFFAGNEAGRLAELSDLLGQGSTVVLVSDAGMPGISDPGFTAVRAALEGAAEVTGVPGPSAVTLALAISGLPADRFVFEGFLPRKGARRTARLSQLGEEPRTAVLFSTGRRLGADLADLLDACGGERPLALCRELTKRFEEVWRGSLADAVDAWPVAKGEVTLVLGGAPEQEFDIGAALDEVAALMEGGESRSEAVRRVAAASGLPRRALYEASLGND